MHHAKSIHVLNTLSNACANIFGVSMVWCAAWQKHLARLCKKTDIFRACIVSNYYFTKIQKFIKKVKPISHTGIITIITILNNYDKNSNHSNQSKPQLWIY